MAEVVGITQQRVDQLEKDTSNTNICNACIPELSEAGKLGAQV